ncbi:MAG: haloacid dehalogenase-like hydrolase [Clostridia bacterium]|nr:haloacid dehalogenase-like hydrolase [Clostridia bacterium]
MNVYDFDNTVFYGDSTFRFYRYCLKRHPMMLLRLPRLAWDAIFLLKKDKQRFKQRAFGFLKTLKDPEGTVNRFWDKNIGRIKPFYLEQKRDDDVIISASPEFLIVPAMARLSRARVMASPIDLHTAEYSGPNCHGQEKVRRFREVYGDAAIDEFYSDSHSDDPLAEIALRAFMVKGDRIFPWPGKA